MTRLHSIKVETYFFIPTSSYITIRNYTNIHNNFIQSSFGCYDDYHSLPG
jgi:hypothetical protein